MVQALEVKVAFVRARWETPRSDAPKLADWSDAVLEQIFQVRNGWSLGSYWDACSLGLRKLKFKFYDLHVLKGEQGTKQERGDVIKRALDQCNVENIFTEPYDHFIILVSPAGNNSGALGGDILFDQNGEHEFFAHELGHLLGLEHPYGWNRLHLPEVYKDDYCLMGYTGPNHSEMDLPANPPGIVSSFPPWPKQEGDPHYFWYSGRMPSAATMYRYWPNFQNTPGFVHVATAAMVGQTVTLTALSEIAEGGPVLLLISTPSGGSYYVEYRLNTGWDKGFTRQQGVPRGIVVVHSYKIFSSYLYHWHLEGGDRVWFNYAIEQPFHDAWVGSDDVGVEVVSQSADSKKVTLRIVNGSSRKRAELVERQRGRLDETIAQAGTVLLDRSSDANLCSNDPKPYSVEIVTFGEQVTVDLVLNGFADPVIEEWTLNEQVLAGTSGHATPGVYAERNVILNSPVGQAQRLSLGKDRYPAMPRIDYGTGLNGIILTTSPRVGSYELRITCKVRDRAMNAAEPGAIRIATLAIHIDGDRVVYDETYRNDAERCWWVRRQVPQPVHDWPPHRNELLLPWMDPLDKHAVSDLMQRLRLQGIDLKPRRER